MPEFRDDGGKRQRITRFATHSVFYSLQGRRGGRHGRVVSIFRKVKWLLKLELPGQFVLVEGKLDVVHFYECASETRLEGFVAFFRDGGLMKFAEMPWSGIPPRFGPIQRVPRFRSSGARSLVLSLILSLILSLNRRRQSGVRFVTCTMTFRMPAKRSNLMRNFAGLTR